MTILVSFTTISTDGNKHDRKLTLANLNALNEVSSLAKS